MSIILNNNNNQDIIDYDEYVKKHKELLKKSHEIFNEIIIHYNLLIPSYKKK